MKKEQGAQEGMNEMPTCTDNDAGMTQARSLDVLQRDLARLRPNLPSDPDAPHDARGMASEAIEGIKELRRGNQSARDGVLQAIERLAAVCSVER